MSTFRAFQTGLAAGQEQARVRREDDARMKASDLFGKGNFEGAVSSLMGVGLMQDADAYTRAGERRQEAERTKAYGDAFRTGLGAGAPPRTSNKTQPMMAEPSGIPQQISSAIGQSVQPQPQQPQPAAPNMRGGYEAVRGVAASRGDIDMMQQVEQALSGMDEQQKAGLTASMEFLGQTALSLKGVPPEARGQAAMEILQNSPYANPQILQQIQQAAADGRITDEELDNFAMQTMSVAERVKREDANKPKAPEAFTLSPGQVRYGPDGKTVLARVPDRPQANAGQAPPSGYRWGPDGSLVAIPGGPADKPGGVTTESERAAGLHAGISINGLQNLQQMEASGYNRAGGWEQAGGVVGGENERLYDQAADEFIDGYLRAMTGAAATPAEISQYRKQWFPSFGDSPAVVQQKAEGRLNAIKQMKSKTGRSWNPEWDGIITQVEQQVGGGMSPVQAGAMGAGGASRMAGSVAQRAAQSAPSAADATDDELLDVLGLR